jgi:hypothetical protein
MVKTKEGMTFENHEKNKQHSDYKLKDAHP